MKIHGVPEERYLNKESESHSDEKSKTSDYYSLFKFYYKTLAIL
ncbi:hypothetical protein BD94_3468 [Elizabethkingia anophelis NUHP1]|uniref:Uncharacterized protein n=1 Tax=Elizabethkingia anophelis NUHP1 TaxID=1338011 RepID=A0A077EL89_9FLAO|nr:hypothetical protein BD94_3468 [Elizabethkingia anophelis NUHP1]